MQSRRCLEAMFQAKSLLRIHLQLLKPELRPRPLAMGGHDLCERAEYDIVTGTKRHFITWESNFPALCKKVRHISCSPRISHELFSKHSNTPQPTSPAFTRQCWISAETAERAKMSFVTLVKGRHLSLILGFLWAYTLNAFSDNSVLRPFFLYKIAT